MKHMIDIIIKIAELSCAVLLAIFGVTYQSNKILSIWMLYGSLIIGLFSVFLNWQNNIWESQERKQENNQHDIMPRISCTMEYPIKISEDNISRNKHNPEIVISNNGPVKALSFSATVDIYEFDLNQDKITAFVSQITKNFDHTFSQDELNPFHEVRFPTMGISGNEILSIYVVKMTYYAEPEMKQFDLAGY